jgi:release factor glutamine methyltransferase
MVTSKVQTQNVGEILAGLISRFQRTSETAELDAQVLLADVLDKSRAWILAHPEATISNIQSASLNVILARMECGEPLPYVLGSWEFFGLQFEVTPDVLIPRPETELLVEEAIRWLKKPGPADQGLKVIDVGTGSGCIAISLAVSVPGLSITAIDISPAALEVARRNAEKMGVSDCITFVESDLFSNPSIQGPFTLMVANPPYIPTEILHNLTVYNREPTHALDGGGDGLAVIRRILKESSDRLIPGGLLLMEIESSEGPAALSLASGFFPKARILLHKDLAGQDRLLEIQK